MKFRLEGLGCLGTAASRAYLTVGKKRTKVWVVALKGKVPQALRWVGEQSCVSGPYEKALCAQERLC